MPRVVRPTLLTIDWHTDTGSNGEDILDAVNLEDDGEVALFCWSQLCPNNDGQICAAAWLEVIGDVLVLCKQNEPDAYDYVTRGGKSRFTLVHDAAEFLRRARNISGPVLLDIDLDYFTNSDDEGGGEDPPTLALEGMSDLLCPSSPLLTAIGPNLIGLTIATEPEFCGGFQASANILAALDDTMFAGTLGSQDVRWATERGRAGR
ncbi:MAG: hypothetical protein Q8P18_21325 [Pseudomonadota bacterium]|nr:hypothetical protein [Pseudomonadota bacterium]